MFRPNLPSIPETFSESYREDTDWEGLTQALTLQYDLFAGPARVYDMTHGFLQRSLACLLIVSLIVIGGVAAAQSLNHESQHSHHQKTTHGTVLCSWMCAAGQVLDSSAAPYLAEHSPVAVVDQLAFQLVPRTILDSPTSRGPPSHSI